MYRSQPSTESTPRRIGQKNTRSPVKGGTPSTQIVEYKKKAEKLNNYQEKLNGFERKLKARKRKFNFSLKEKLSTFTDQETEIEKQLVLLAEQSKKIKTHKNQYELQISEEKFKLIKLEEEKNRLFKTEKAAETTFTSSFSKTVQSNIRGSIYEKLTEIADMKMKSRSLRSKIFVYQKQLLKLYDDIAPVRTRIHLIQARIDENDNDITEKNELSSKTQTTIKAAIAAQHLTIEKMKIQRHIDEINQGFEEMKEEKHNIMKKLVPLRSTNPDVILQSILEQINQYEEASQRRRNYFDNKVLTVHDAISKELEIKIEIDGVEKEIKEINQQKVEMKNSLMARKKEIESLQNSLASSNLKETNKENPLDELINQIKNLREIEKELAQTKPKNYQINETELDQARNQCDAEYNELKLSVEKQIDINRQMREEIKKREKIAEEKQIETPKIVIRDTPKIIILKQRIDSIENEVKEMQKTNSKKRGKILKKNSKFQSYFEKLDLSRTRIFFRSEIAEHIERSMNWFLPMIRTQIHTLISLNINIPQIIGQWDSKILTAVINEAEELNLKSLILCK